VGIIALGAAIANFGAMKDFVAGLGLGSMFEMLGYLGLDSVVSLFLMIVHTILSILANYLLLYLSISLGCMLAKKHRFIVCGACYLGVTTVVSVISYIVSIIVVFVLAAAATQVQNMGIIINIILAAFSALVAVEAVACYFITRYILKNKVNLD
jgi:hypothetical protein